MNHGSLFSGIGGFDLAAEWMGWNNIFHCEWNPFGQRVLKHYWPNADVGHRWIEENPKLAKERGFSVSRLKLVTPLNQE